MSELDDIKERAAERREKMEWYDAHSSVSPQQLLGEAEADLDRAIAIAEDNELTLERHIFNVTKGVAEYQQMEKERDEARAAGQQLAKDAVLLADELTFRTGERNEARAAVLRLRDAVQRMWDIDCGYQDRTGPNVLDETESYEEYR